jgi:hypothetical protein
MTISKELWLERAAYIEKLRAELEAAKADRELLNNACNVYCEKLAARDLVIKQITDLASAYLCNPHHGVGYIEEIALIQPNTEALDAYVAQAVSQEREACAVVCESLPRKFRSDFHSVAEECAGAIRARKP